MFVTSIWNFRAITHKPESDWIDLPVRARSNLAGRKQPMQLFVQIAKNELGPLVIPEIRIKKAKQEGCLTANAGKQ